LPPDTLVSDIAFDSGFSHLGRFSVDYRKSFGRTPRESQIAGSIC
jgi:AraC-like DNA-binding protein